MLSFFMNQNIYIQAFIASLVAFIFTMSGSLTVFLFKKINKKIINIFIAFAAGVMLASSFFSLLNPALALAEDLKMIPWIVCLIGLLLGTCLLILGDKVFQNRFNNYKRPIKLLTSITLHNIPEGLAIGVAFGSIKYHIPGATLMSAIILALGIAIQNFPEGISVSLPLKNEGFSNKKSFLYGVISGSVEPISGILGALLVMKVRLALPFLLAFAAGAMIYVVCDELIVECNSDNDHKYSLYIMIGFALMMMLDLMFS